MINPIDGPRPVTTETPSQNFNEVLRDAIRSVKTETERPTEEPNETPKELNERDFSKAFAQVAELLKNTDLDIEVNNDIDRYVVSVYDRETKEQIKQIPAEEIVNLLTNLRNVLDFNFPNDSIFVNEKV